MKPHSYPTQQLTEQKGRVILVEQSLLQEAIEIINEFALMADDEEGSAQKVANRLKTILHRP